MVGKQACFNKHPFYTSNRVLEVRISSQSGFLRKTIISSGRSNSDTLAGYFIRRPKVRVLPGPPSPKNSYSYDAGTKGSLVPWCNPWQCGCVCLMGRLTRCGTTQCPLARKVPPGVGLDWIRDHVSALNISRWQGAPLQNSDFQWSWYLRELRNMARMRDIWLPVLVRI